MFPEMTPKIFPRMPPLKKTRFTLLLIATLLAAPAGVPTSGQSASSDEAAVQQELREFVPSEEVKADTAVDFPVDI
jgi:hypothetical protein